MNRTLGFKLILIILALYCISEVSAQSSTEVLITSNVDFKDESIFHALSQARKSNLRSLDPTLVIIGSESKAVSDFDIIVKRISELKEDYENVYFIPGSKDWQNLGAKGIKELDDLLQDAFEQDILIPDNACGEVETKDIASNVVLATMDSEWYLQNWDNDNYINKGCLHKDRERFWISFADELSSYKEKVVLLFTYHPPLRYDNSSGFYPFTRHLIPFPVIGSLLLNIKSAAQTYDKGTHPRYHSYYNKINMVIGVEPNIISIAGQAGYQMDHHTSIGRYINVNSTKADDYVADSRLDWSHDKESYLIIDVSDQNISRRWYDIGSHKIIHQGVDPIDREVIDTVGSKQYQLEELGDSITLSIHQKGDILQLNDKLFGDLNSDLYFTPITVPVLNLNAQVGGLDPVRMGGGRQTKSVRYKGDDGKYYVTRSLKKSPDKLVPHPFDISPIESIVSYFFTAANPYSFLASNALEKELQLYHTLPSLMYLPKQRALTPYNDEVGDQLVLVRARADDDQEDQANFGFSKDVISTSDLIDEIRENDAMADSYSFLRARLLDLILNDWDRHEDQWRWAKDRIKEDTLNTYFPIPRDRDQALSNYNGWALAYYRQFIPTIFQLKPFDDDLSKHDITWMHYVASYLDKMILTKMTYDEWMSIALEIKEELTSDVIQNALMEMPSEIEDSYIVETSRLLQKRVEGLEATAETFYNLINNKALVLGSYGKDSVHVKHLSTGTNVALYAKDDNDQTYTKFEKLFDPTTTEEVWIYTMEGKDVFVVEGILPKIKIRCIGGFDRDEYSVADKVSSKTLIYEHNGDVENSIASNGAVKLSDSKEIVSINRSDFMFNHKSFAPNWAINSDDGVYIGLKHAWTNFEFKKNSIHQLEASFATMRTSSALSYSGRFNNELSDISQNVNIQYFGPRYELNYFGFGNDKPIDDTFSNDYYFVRKKEIYVNYGIEKNMRDISGATLDLTFQRIQIDDFPNRFISQEEFYDAELLTNQFFTGLKIAYFIDNFDNALKPINGIRFDVSLKGNKHLNSGDKDHLTFSVATKFYKGIGPSDRFIYASSLGYSKVWGDQYFYQSPSIGGGTSLRGLRRDRFYGDAAFYHNNDLYINIGNKTEFNDRNHSWGISLSLDHGRVWSETDASDDWHVNHGVGLFFSPLDAIVISGGLYFSAQESQIRIGAGWQL